MTRAYHVFGSPSGGWCVKQTGSNRAVESFPSRNQAIAFAQQLAQQELGGAGRSVVVHQKSAFSIVSKLGGRVYVVKAKGKGVPKPRPVFGSAKGKFVIGSDFEKIPEEFAGCVG